MMIHLATGTLHLISCPNTSNEWLKMNQSLAKYSSKAFSGYWLCTSKTEPKYTGWQLQNQYDHHQKGNCLAAIAMAPVSKRAVQGSEVEALGKWVVEIKLPRNRTRFWLRSTRQRKLLWLMTQLQTRIKAQKTAITITSTDQQFEITQIKIILLKES